jgi:cytochrome c biogenesis protein CcmG/thiol:disulfide interchange protein DsbE
MPENRRMRPTATELLVFLAVAAALVAIGAALLRTTRARGLAHLLGWLVLGAGLAAVAALALAEFTGRLGPENLWFRAPSFYGASVILLGAAIWWLRRPAPRALRFGLPAILAGLLGLGALLARSDGRSTPLAMLMPSMGTPAPELSYFDSSGARRELSELRGRVVLLNFWATWCAPCRREMPMLSELQREHADEGLVVLYVSLEEPEILTPFLAANRFDGIQGRLDYAASFYDAGKFYPLSYLISRDGRVRQRWSGRPTEDWLAAQVRAEL